MKPGTRMGAVGIFPGPSKVPQETLRSEPLLNRPKDPEVSTYISFSFTVILEDPKPWDVLRRGLRRVRSVGPDSTNRSVRGTL